MQSDPAYQQVQCGHQGAKTTTLCLLPSSTLAQSVQPFKIAFDISIQSSKLPPHLAVRLLESPSQVACHLTCTRMAAGHFWFCSLKARAPELAFVSNALYLVSSTQRSEVLHCLWQSVAEQAKHYFAQVFVAHCQLEEGPVRHRRICICWRRWSFYGRGPAFMTHDLLLQDDVHHAPRTCVFKYPEGTCTRTTELTTDACTARALPPALVPSVIPSMFTASGRSPDSKDSPLTFSVSLLGCT